jgi:alkane 1-monooxygenase
MNFYPLKYLTPFLLFLFAYYGLQHTGWACWLAVAYAFLMVPLLELILKPDPSNLTETQEALALENKSYDIILYLAVVLQYIVLWIFLKGIDDPTLQTVDIIGRTLSMGLLCGSFGINVAHELGHRINKFDQTLSKLLLLTSLYMHFFIEHNKGHHKEVATPQDPSTARYRQTVFAFWPQTLLGTYRSDWKIAGEDQQKKGRKKFTLYNEMLQFQIIQVLFLTGIFFMFGMFALTCFICAAIVGILLLETVNYIEHYGLERSFTERGNYEKVQAHHSWNSNHVIGRLMLFELSRHSDHHYKASRKYQILRHIDTAPQMPTGYPGMILLALVPPLWFKIMHARMNSISK